MSFESLLFKENLRESERSPLSLMGITNDSVRTWQTLTGLYSHSNNL